MDNSRIAHVLNRFAELMAVKGEIRFKIQAYERAARVVEGHSLPLAQVYAEGGVKALGGLSGIGAGIARRIGELLSTGQCQDYLKLKAGLPPGIEELLDVPYLGPKTAVLLAKELGISSVAELEKAVRGRKLRALPRLGAKQEERLLKGIALWKQGQERSPLGFVLPHARRIEAALGGIPGVERVVCAGSIRRMKETVGDLDFLACPGARGRGPDIIEAFAGLPDVAETGAKGETKASVRLKNGLAADLRVVPAESFGAALHYFTGAKAHNIQIREMGVKRGLKINEYGVFKGKRRVAGASEEEVFKAVRLPPIPPELREGAGEVEAALSGELPDLIEGKDLRGDLHVHSEWSDGRSSLEEMARRAIELGYEYLAPCDHSQSLRLASGLSVKDLARKNREIDALNRRLEGLRLLKGAEVDILADGSLDYPDDVLAELDVVVAAVHTRFGLEEEAQTGRICRALTNRYVNILAHPTGRLLNKRDPYAVDLSRVIKAARENGKALELNAQPDRMDLTEVWLKAAREAGVPVAINTDAHQVRELDYGRELGVGLARRGWIEAKDVLNTFSLKKLVAKLGP